MSTGNTTRTRPEAAGGGTCWLFPLKGAVIIPFVNLFAQGYFRLPPALPDVVLSVSQGDIQ